ncbi:MAG: (2Fe-2S)-binding protein, partial [Candidatus Korarchaeota archaeon]|nr:(2Fe-2S)-binding protein [Candidatus Korarchaeota archaeon]
INLRQKAKWKARRRGIHGNGTARGRMICRCNLVRESEIREAIRRMKCVGVKTPSVDSVKFRTSATAGTCQGSFCRIEIARILAEEFDVPLWDVTLKGRGSELGVGDVKVLLRR